MAFKSKYENGMELDKNAENQIKNIEDKISALETKKGEIESQIQNLYKEKDVIMDHQYEIFDKKLDQEFREYLTEFNFKKCYKINLSSCSSTVELLDDFIKGEKDFLLLRHQFRFNTYNAFDLVITPYYSGIRSIGLQPTMSELKQNVGVDVNYKKCKRLIPLLEELENYRYKDKKIGTINILDNFYIIGGQNSSNRTGYGSEWYNGYCYLPGTLYGEVTDYLVVGFIPWEE